MQTDRAIVFDELNGRDLSDAAALAARVFGASAFYRRALGFDQRRFDAYWALFLTLTLSDPRARAFVLRDSERVIGLAILGREGFPSWWRGALFVARLARRVGARATARYLRFVVAYEHVMAAPRDARDRTVRGYWILVDPEVRRLGVGVWLMRRVLRRAVDDGASIVTGFVDGSDDRLISLYRHLGFTVHDPFRIVGAAAVKIDWRPQRADGRA